MADNEETTIIEKDMSIIGHLDELRQSIIISLISIFLTSILCFVFKDFLLNGLMMPLRSSIDNISVVMLSPPEMFTATIRMSLMMGLMLALPIILNRIYWFISPGLSKDERKLSFPIIIASYVLFLSGVSFSYFILLPFGVKFLINFAPDSITPMISIGKYISFCSTLIIGTGIIFELPVVIFFLAIFRIVNSKLLMENRKYALLIAFIIGAIVTPSIDVITQSLLAGALYFLYEVSIILVKTLELKRKKIDQDLT